VRKGTTWVLGVGLALIAGLVARSSCRNEQHNTTKSETISAPVARTAKPVARVKRPAPTPTGSAVVASTPDAAADGRVVFFSPWGGSEKDHLGRERPQEANPTAPMSLALGRDGKIHVLDQVNHRVVHHNADGTVAGTSDVSLREAQDIAVGKDGSMAVMDRLGDKTIALYDPDGAIRGQLPLEGDGVEETGLVTGVFVDGDDVYVEREHGPLVKIGDTQGRPADKRTEIPGRPSRDGLSYISAGIIDAGYGRAYVSSIDRATNEHRFTRELRFKSEIRTILLLDTDLSGTIYFAVSLFEEPSSEWVVLQCLDPLKGVPIGSAILPVNTMPEETFRDFAVLDAGGVVYAVRSEKGVTYQKFDCGG
jgi:hypothetical protein